MGKKIFISYKYADTNVCQFPGCSIFNPTTVRDYVDKLEHYFDATDNIYKGESDGEDLSSLSENVIWEKLKDRIYDSSVTLLVISPGMKEPFRSERSQWIPWEVSFSLKETTRNDRTSHTNAMLAIVLPDRNGSYDYFMTTSDCGVVTHHTDKLFKIIQDNMFNIKHPKGFNCSHCGRFHYQGECSYIESVRWDVFIINPNYYINKAIYRQNNIDNYNICKEV